MSIVGVAVSMVGVAMSIVGVAMQGMTITFFPTCPIGK